MVRNIQILTHRGIEYGEKAFAENSLESFKDHLKRGFGIEFDINFCKDDLIILHDSDLNRITDGKDKRNLIELTKSEIQNIFHKKYHLHLCSFSVLLSEIAKGKSNLNALHFKGKYQNKKNIDLVLSKLSKNKKASKKILIFDLIPKFAKYIKNKNPSLILASSVAHEYDIARYNSYIGETLISMELALKNKNIYDWVWLDEWDLNDKENKFKKFYTKENFVLLKKAGYKIGLVTPELHSTSPGLYGGENHQDAKNIFLLLKRIKEIINLNPDLICTDYPEEVRNLL